MADFANRVPPYDVWTEPVRKTRLARLLSIINKCAATSLATVVHRQEFEDIIPEKAREICGDAYGLAAIVCWMEIGEMIREMDVDAWGSYVFEGGARGAGTILKIFQHNVNDPVQKERLRLLSLRPGLSRRESSCHYRPQIYSHMRYIKMRLVSRGSF